ncbi:MAG: TlpA family protein disulfide reductase [Bacteroidales bacterium]|nr:TlpA family protein disulfide reductase [Bacteroidales bacterium]
MHCAAYSLQNTILQNFYIFFWNSKILRIFAPVDKSKHLIYTKFNMKKIFIALAFAVAFVGCSQNDKPEGVKPSEVKAEVVLTPEQEFEQTINNLKKQLKRRNSNKDSLQQVYDDYLAEQSKKHMGTQLGLSITRSMAIDFNVKQLDSVMNLCELYANDDQLKRLSKAAIAAEVTAVGKHYVDINGIDLHNAKKRISLSSIVNKGKPVVVNFWAPWSIPSRDIIRKQLVEYNLEYAGKVNFVSVAVLEDSITFIHRAASEMAIEWTSIYADNPQESPTVKYGTLGIPFVMIIGKNGIIKERNVKAEDIKAAIDKELGRK